MILALPLGLAGAGPLAATLAARGFSPLCVARGFGPVSAGPLTAMVVDGEQWRVGSESADADLRVPGTPSEAHRRLFTPRAAPVGAYSVTLLPDSMTSARRGVMAALAVPEPPQDATTAPGSLVRRPWSVQRLEVGEAFGASGVYEPVRLARLFNGRRAEVVRGPVVRAGRTVASVTLISPYPDASLSRLEPGTLVILLRL